MFFFSKVPFSINLCTAIIIISSYLKKSSVDFWDTYLNDC